MPEAPARSTVPGAGRGGCPSASASGPEEPQTLFPGEGEGGRPRVERPYPAFEVPGIARPVEDRVGLPDARREGRRRLVLGPRCDAVRRETRHRLGERFRSDAGEPSGEGAGGVVRPDRARPGEEDGAGIDPLVHLHNRRAGLDIAGEQRMLNRGRAAPPRKKRRVDVDASGGRNGEDVRGQDEAVGGGDDEVRTVGGEALARCAVAQALGLLDRESEIDRRGFDRARGRPAAASGGPVRTGVHPPRSGAVRPPASRATGPRIRACPRIR